LINFLSIKMRGFKNNQGSFFHCYEIGERNWVLRLVGSGNAVNVAARNVSKNPSQRLDTGNIPTPWWFTSECEQQLLSIGEDGKIPSSIKPESSSPDSTIVELTEEQLRTRLKTQLEYYFSRENLNQDRYLRSQMDNDQYVPINVVANFPKISHLTTDHDLILSVLKESINVQVDESNTKVRAAHRRCTLLLREIPEFTDEREVKSMFIGCPPYTSLKYGLNNSWYVTFETEEATQLAFLHLQNLRKSFNGKQICVRIKTGSAPFPDPSSNGRNSPTKSEIFVGIGNGISTVATSKGYITGFPASSSFILNPNNTRQTTENELNLEQFMGSFGYTIRAIFQPKESQPPKDETENVSSSEDSKKLKSSNEIMTVRSILGPPSTEIVGSMLSAAAEANETKRREKEVQKQQWQQIMDNLAPMSSIMGGQRITDMPFIKRAPPVLHRFVSQESADIEVALDIQRAARKKEATKQQQEQQQIQEQQQKIQEEKYQVQHQQHSHHSYHDGYRQPNRTYPDRSNNKDYNQYNGYSSGERSTTYDRGSDKRSNQSSYRGGYNTRKSFDSRSDRSGKSGEYHYKPRERIDNNKSFNNTTNNYYQENRSSVNYNNQQQRYEKPRYQSERKPSSISSAQPRSYQNVPQIQTTSYSVPHPTATVSTAVSSAAATSDHQPKERERAVSNPEPITEHHSTSPLPVLIVPSNSSSTIIHSDAASSTTSSRRKDNSESSEYNFVDQDFPSLVEKQKIQVKEKAKFSAVVAGKQNDVKKSYAQTLKKPENAKQSNSSEVT
jgi:hypothetical protein